MLASYSFLFILFELTLLLRGVGSWKNSEEFTAWAFIVSLMMMQSGWFRSRAFVLPRPNHFAWNSWINCEICDSSIVNCFAGVVSPFEKLKNWNNEEMNNLNGEILYRFRDELRLDLKETKENEKQYKTN